MWSAIEGVRYVCFSPQWQARVVPVSTFADDAAKGTLPAVSWLIPDFDVSEHPTVHAFAGTTLSVSACARENWTVQPIHPIMQGPLCPTTPHLLTSDEFRGFYDHRPPPP